MGRRRPGWQHGGQVLANAVRDDLDPGIVRSAGIGVGHGCFSAKLGPAASIAQVHFLSTSRTDLK